jgi:hypothetical protein
MSYDGLNELLQSKDSLAAGTRSFVDAITFDTRTDLPTNYIGSANIRNFNFSQGQGGTLSLGGTLNGDGLLVVNNNAGSPVVTLNNTGIAVNNGSITIQNSSGSTSFDNLGVVSLQNFTQTSSTYSGTTVENTGGTAEFDLPDGSATFVLTRSACVLIQYSLSHSLYQAVGTADTSYIILSVKNGTAAFAAADFTINSFDPSIQTYRSQSSFWVGNVTAGTKTIKLSNRLFGVSGTPTALMAAYTLSYTILGT